MYAMSINTSFSSQTNLTKIKIKMTQIESSSKHQNFNKQAALAQDTHPQLL